MKISVTKEYEDEFEYQEDYEYQQELKDNARKYEDLYRWARNIWKYTDKETITVDELQDAFIKEYI